jgi:hypothetical protein
MSDSPEEEPAHEGVVGIESIATPGAPAEAGVPNVKFVHYPGSQQLILWLPRGWHEGYEDVVLSRDGVEIERMPAGDKVNGSTQMLWATLSWPPGEYLIAVSHKDGWRHEVKLRKYEVGQRPPEPPKPPPEPTRGPIVYRDGFGKVIPDVDLELRAQAQRDIRQKFLGRHLEYEGNYRGGTITYNDGDRRISFWHEMAGGNIHFYIDVPTAEQWEAATKTPLSERDKILTFVAERVKAEKASTWQYRITDRSIDFY